MPSAYLDLTGRQNITIDVMALIQDGNKPYFERPYSMEVEVPSAGGTTSVATVELDTTKPTPVIFNGGKYRIVKFNWVKFGQPQFLYTGGKG